MGISKNKQVNVVLISLFVTISIVIIRFVAFIISNSVLILSDALHSLFDLVSGIIATYAIFIASKPSDIEHTYGHGKAENIGGFLESIILIIILLFIIYESYFRLIYIQETEIYYGWLIILLIGITIILNIWRSRALIRAAKVYKNQIIEADALHFLSDLYGTLPILAIVILGSTVISNSIILKYLDPIAAIVVSVYFAYPSIRISKSAIDELMDRAPKGIIEEVQKIITEEGAEVERIRCRKSGNKVFIDAIIKVPENFDIKEMHKITEAIEKRVDILLGNLEADVVIHAEPSVSREVYELKSNIAKITKDIKSDLRIHNVEISKTGGKYDVRMHLEFEPTTKITEAHDIAHRIEERIKSDVYNINSITIHLEPKKEIGKEKVDSVLEELTKTNEDLFKKIKVKKCFIAFSGGNSYIDMICRVPANITVEEAHTLATKLENLIREKLGEDIIITVHTEPY